MQLLVALCLIWVAKQQQKSNQVSVMNNFPLLFIIHPLASCIQQKLAEFQN